MKRVTTNMSFGQLLFVIVTLFAASGMSFYFGTKFGSKVLQWGNSDDLHDGFLPDEKVAIEVRDLLANAKVDYTFFEVVQNQKGYSSSTALANSDIPRVKIEKPVEMAVPQDKPVAALSDEDKGKSKETQRQDAKDLSKSKDAAIPPEASDTKVALEVASSPTHTLPISEKPAPEKLAPEKPKPALIEKPAEVSNEKAQADTPEEFNETRYLLQTGSYASLKKAEKARDTWKKRGYKAEIVKAQIPGKGEWYRLRLGLYNDYATIQTHQKSIQQKYNESAMILPIQ